MILGLFCVFKWTGLPSPVWELHEVFEQIAEGYVGKVRVGDFEYQVARTPPTESASGEWEPIPGRLVWYWSWATGPVLIQFYPPTDWPRWLWPNGLYYLKKNDPRTFASLIRGNSEVKSLVVEQVIKRVGGVR